MNKSISHNEYLKKYTTEHNKSNNKIKNSEGLLIIDKDPIWQKPASIQQEDEEVVDPRHNQPNSPKLQDMSPPRRKRPHSATYDGLVMAPRSGLLTAEEMREEIARKKNDELRLYKELDPLLSGRGAEPIYRDKFGNRISKKLQKEDENPKRKEKDLEWGIGLVQKREAEAKQRELEFEKERPFARATDDPDLDKMLKQRVRWGDPMASLVKPKQGELVLEDFSENEKMKESGFIVPQSVPDYSWIVRRVDAPENRYGIKPGRHWDGVDRNNGYEKNYFGRSNEKLTNEREAYVWSVSDM